MNKRNYKTQMNEIKGWDTKWDVESRRYEREQERNWKKSAREFSKKLNRKEAKMIEQDRE